MFVYRNNGRHLNFNIFKYMSENGHVGRTHIQSCDKMWQKSWQTDKTSNSFYLSLSTAVTFSFATILFSICPFLQVQKNLANWLKKEKYCWRWKRKWKGEDVGITLFIAAATLLWCRANTIRQHRWMKDWKKIYKLKQNL